MKPIKVMIVEDDLLIAECMRNTLVNEGYIVFDPVDSRYQALEMVKNMKPDLVLMDIRLEKQEEGIPIAQEIRKTYLLPIIFITQLHDKEVFKQAKEVFPKSYLTKPYNDSDLIRAVELAILNSEKWLKNRKINAIEQIKDGIYLTETGSTLKTKLLYEDILYIKAAKAYTEIYYEANGTIASKPYVVTLSSNNGGCNLNCVKVNY
jgi:DNA-binding response OmpR family regulator